MYCSKCGTSVSPGAKFCPRCGNPVGQTSQTNAPGANVPGTQKTFPVGADDSWDGVWERHANGASIELDLFGEVSFLRVVDANGKVSNFRGRLNRSDAMKGTITFTDSSEFVLSVQDDGTLKCKMNRTVVPLVRTSVKVPARLIDGGYRFSTGRRPTILLSISDGAVDYCCLLPDGAMAYLTGTLSPDGHVIAFSSGQTATLSDREYGTISFAMGKQKTVLEEGTVSATDRLKDAWAPAAHVVANDAINAAPKVLKVFVALAKLSGA